MEKLIEAIKEILDAGDCPLCPCIHIPEYLFNNLKNTFEVEIQTTWKKGDFAIYKGELVEILDIAYERSPNRILIKDKYASLEKVLFNENSFWCDVIDLRKPTNEEMEMYCL